MFVELKNYFDTCGVGSKRSTTSPPRARLVTTTTTAAATIVLVVARVIFKRRNPVAAEDWSVKVLIVARAIFSGTQAPKKGCCGSQRPGREPDPGKGPSFTHQHMRAATTRGLPPTASIPTPPKSFIINDFFIAARSFSNCPTLQGTEKSYAAARGDPDASLPHPRLPLGDT